MSTKNRLYTMLVMLVAIVVIFLAGNMRMPEGKPLAVFMDKSLAWIVVAILVGLGLVRMINDNKQQ